MSSMFSAATKFNRDIAAWNTAGVTSMAYIFNGASAFNQNLASWSTTRVTNMTGAFQSASAFNGDVSGRVAEQLPVARELGIRARWSPEPWPS
jgi:surface protein